MATGTYSISCGNVAITTSKSIIVYQAAGTVAAELLRVAVSQNNLDVTDQMRIQVLRKTTAPSGGTAITPAPVVGAPAAAGTTSYSPTSDGTDGAILVEDVFNILTGWNWVWLPEERPIIQPQGLVGIKLPTAPASSTNFSATLILREIG